MNVINFPSFKLYLVIRIQNLFYFASPNRHFTEFLATQFRMDLAFLGHKGLDSEEYKSLKVFHLKVLARILSSKSLMNLPEIVDHTS